MFKDVFGSELLGGDVVLFSPHGTTELREGEISSLDTTNEDNSIAQVTWVNVHKETIDSYVICEHLIKIVDVEREND